MFNIFKSLLITGGTVHWEKLGKVMGNMKQNRHISSKDEFKQLNFQKSFQ